MADGANPFQLCSLAGVDEALMRSHAKGDPNVIAKLVFREQPLKASGAAESMNVPACNQAAPFYCSFAPDGLVSSPISTDDRVQHLREKHVVTAGDLIFADAIPVSSRVLFSLMYDAPLTMQSASRL